MIAKTIKEFNDELAEKGQVCYFYGKVPQTPPKIFEYAYKLYEDGGIELVQRLTERVNEKKARFQGDGVFKYGVFEYIARRVC
jgi:hypothetical protein